MKELIAIEEASTHLATWVAAWRASSTKHEQVVALKDALERRLAFPVTVDRALPPYDRVMMDGIAVRAQDWVKGEAEYRLVATQAAGSEVNTDLAAGDAVEVMTGSVCPGVAEETVIVPVERLLGGMPPVGDVVRVESAAHAEITAGQFIHRRAADARAGDILLDAGSKLGPAELGVLASCGVATVRVVDRVRVAVLSTGDELVAVEDQPEPHQIRRSNDVVISAFVEKMGAEVVACRHVGDERSEVVAVLAELVGVADVVAISGGASMGSRDHIPTVLADRCGEPIFHGVKQRPGKPFGVWDGGQTLFCALPGNPVSVLACLCRHLGPLLMAMNDDWRGPGKRVLAEEWCASFGFRMLKPVRAVDGERVEILQMKNSGDFAGLAGMIGFVELPEQEAEGGSSQKLDFFPLC